MKLDDRLNEIQWLGRTNWEVREVLFGGPIIRSHPSSAKEPYIVFDRMYTTDTVLEILKLVDENSKLRTKLSEIKKQ